MGLCAKALVRERRVFLQNNTQLELIAKIYQLRFKLPDIFVNNSYRSRQMVPTAALNYCLTSYIIDKSIENAFHRRQKQLNRW